MAAPGYDQQGAGKGRVLGTSLQVSEVNPHGRLSAGRSRTMGSPEDTGNRNGELPECGRETHPVR
ncbi:hypothetical protein ASZ90_016937 [hydrocarbon metagenome]|uniref:Uncharacterized protein n=1 Tax=hydrocarbon metagenome TaxID=938273 RepID=A0A0W8EAS9_9ZZZZ